jgi:hypothetical protein
MKIENQKITAAGFPDRGPALLDWPSGPTGTARARSAWSPRGGHERDSAVARPACLRRWPRCSASGGDSMGE